MSAVQKSAARLAAALLFLAVMPAAGAMHHEPPVKAGDIAVENAWARATAPNQTIGAAYLTLRNAGATDRLVGGSTPASESVELHTMTMDGGVMRMRPVPHVEVPAGGSVALEPGGLHLMLVGLKAPLKQGEQLMLELRFEKSGTVSVPVRIEAPSGPKGGHGGMQHKH